jgi:hypothetical protein
VKEGDDAQVKASRIPVTPLSSPEGAQLQRVLYALVRRHLIGAGGHFGESGFRFASHGANMAREERKG